MKLLITTQAVDAHDLALGFFVRWIEEFAKHAEQVTIICLQEGEHHFPPNVRVHSLGKEHGVPPLRKLVYVLRFFRILWRMRGQYDAVFVHMNPEYVLLGGWLWRLTGKPIGLWYEHKSVTWILRMAVFFATDMFSASKEGFRLRAAHAHVMGHGIDINRHIPAHIPATSAVRLMTSGRIAPAKRLDVIISAFLHLKKSSVAATLSIFGAPTSPSGEAYKNALVQELVKAGEDPDSVFLGSVPHAHMPERRAAMDYFLHASETGSLDKAVLDAALSGVIPLSSSEAYAELFSGFERYLSYPGGDSAALAGRIMVLEKLPERERDRIKATLKDRIIKQHSLQNLIPKIVYILQNA